VGDQGSEILARLARLRALRDLGPADPATLADFGLSGSDAAMTIRFSDGTVRTLEIGDVAAGGEARYALDVDSARVYALPMDLFTGFETGAGAFRLSAYLPFSSDDVASVSVRSSSATRTMLRRTIDSPPRPVWLPSEGEQHDVAFGILMDQFEQLWVVRYAPEVSEMSLEPVVRVEYTDARGGDLGFLEIMRTRGTAEPAYYMRTPRTIVFGEIYAPQAGRIEADVANQIRAVAPAGVRG
jgi:hypothetical protein